MGALTSSIFVCYALFASAAIANVIQEDGRVLTADAAGVSASDFARFRASTGFVHCPGTDLGNPQTTSAALVHSNEVVVTSAHAFVDDRGRLRSPLSSCYFQTLADHPETRFFDLSRSEIVFDLKTHGDANDFAVLRLDRGIELGRAFKTDRIFPPIRLKTEVLALTTGEVDMPNGHLILRRCSIREIALPTTAFGTNYFGDCDLKRGGSGGVNLVRVENEWVAVGIFQGAGDDHLDGQPYSRASMSYSLSIAMANFLLDAVQRVSER